MKMDRELKQSLLMQIYDLECKMSSLKQDIDSIRESIEAITIPDVAGEEEK